MSYISLYRKYRSQTFDEVSGQEHVTRTLQNAIRGDRVAHAYLFCGARGTGKTTTARLLAKCLNCERGPTPDPCNACENCLRIADGSSMDVIEIDAASNRGIDEIRALREKVQYSPSQSRKKVYVLDEVHMLTSEAFNALLKTLEEPPGHVVFILATTEAHKIPATILSRCQRFDFRRGSLDQIGERLRYVAEQEGHTIEPAAVARIARGAEGSWRDALSLLEQVLAYGEQTITLADVTEVLGAVDADCLHAIAEAVRAGDGAALFASVEELIHAGKDPRQLTRDLVEHYRTLLRAAVGALPANDESGARLAEQATAYGLQRLVQSLELLAQVEKEVRWSDQSRLALEVALVRLMRVGAAGDGATGRRGDGATDDRRRTTEVGRTSPPAPGYPAAFPGLKPGAVVRAAGGPRSGEGRGAPNVTASGSVSDPAVETAARTAGSPPSRTEDRVREGGLPAVPAVTSVAGSPPSTAHDLDAPEYDPFVDRAASSVPAGDTNAAVEETAPVLEAELPPPAVEETPNVSEAETDNGAALSAIQLRWTVVVEELKRRRAMKTSALISDARAVRLVGETLTVRFRYETHVEMFQRGDSRQQLEAALQSVVGGRYRVVAEHGVLDEGASPPGGGSSPPSGEAPVPRRDGPSGGSGVPFARSSTTPEGEEDGGADRLIHEVIAIFNGKIIEE